MVRNKSVYYNLMNVGVQNFYIQSSIGTQQHLPGNKSFPYIKSTS